MIVKERVCTLNEYFKRGYFLVFGYVVELVELRQISKFYTLSISDEKYCIIKNNFSLGVQLNEKSILKVYTQDYWKKQTRRTKLWKQRLYSADQK